MMRKFTSLKVANKYTFLKVADDPFLKKIPVQLPDLMELNIYDLNNPVENNDPKITPFHLHSFKDLPEKLPKLKRINIKNSIISNFEDLTSEMPNLININLDRCHIHNFRGIPLVYLSMRNCTIDSFEGITFDNTPQPIKKPQLILQSSSIRSLGGISRLSLQSILIAYLIHDDGGPEDNTLKLTEKGRQLFYDSINPEIYSTYNPLNLQKWVDNVYEMVIRQEESYNLPHREWDSDYEFYKDNWIFGFHLENLLFITEKLDRLHQYYHKTTLQLAQEYINDFSSLSTPQIERLIHEVNPDLRKMLENNLPSDNPVITQISAKFSFKTSNGPLLK